MGRSKNKSGRRGFRTTANVITLPTRVPYLRVGHFSRRELSEVDYDRQAVAARAMRQTDDMFRRREARRANLRLVEDRRRWHPEGQKRAARAFNRWSPRVITPKWAALGGAAITAKLAFAGPSSVAICVRRKRRREVLMAKGYGGRRGQRRPRRSWYSNIRCRR